MRNALMQPPTAESGNSRYRVDPRYSPYFRPQETGDGMGSLGSGNGNWMQGLFNLPGAEAYTTGGGQVSESSQDPGIDPDALQAYLQANGQNINERGVEGTNSVERWISDSAGNDVGAREQFSLDDDNYWTGAQLAAAVVGSGVSSWANAGGGLEGLSGMDLAADGGRNALWQTGAEAGIPYTVGAADAQLPAEFSGFQNVGGPPNTSPLEYTGQYQTTQLPQVPNAASSLGVGGGSTWNAALADSAVGTGGYGASSAGAGGGATAPWGSGAGYTADAARGSSLGDFFSGNGSTSDYLRAAQTGIGLLSQNAASNAAQRGQSDSNALMREMWTQNRADNQPLLDLRNATLPKINALMSNPSSITQDPGYQFGLNQGQGQIDNQAAARGGYYSGQQLKASQKFGQDYAGTKLDDSLRRLQSVAGLGQVGATQNQSNNNQYSVNGGNGLAQSGSIRGSGYIGMGNTANNALGDWMNDWQSRKAWGGGK